MQNFGKPPHSYTGGVTEHLKLLHKILWFVNSRLPYGRGGKSKSYIQLLNLTVLDYIIYSNNSSFSVARRRHSAAALHTTVQAARASKLVVRRSCGGTY